MTAGAKAGMASPEVTVSVIGFVPVAGYAYELLTNGPDKLLHGMLPEPKLAGLHA